jgi:class 3 adenylate cyclase
VNQIRRKSLNDPDVVRRFPRGVGYLARVGSLAVGRAELEPGWRWSVDVKPLAGTASCEIHHLQLLLAGRFAVRMDGGEEAEFAPLDVFEIPRGHDAWVVGDETVEVLDFYGNIESFALPAAPERVLATILMTDIVDSTATAERLGDAAWKQVLSNHNRVVRLQLDRFRGREVNTTGDGFLVTFSSAVGALRCAAAIAQACLDIDLRIRAGVHTGEIDMGEDDIGGVAVHATARIMALAGPGEVYTSSATRGLAEGSGLRFEERGSHQVKGLESAIEVFRLVG